jgi:hypothetical protein
MGHMQFRQGKTVAGSVSVVEDEQHLINSIKRSESRPNSRLNPLHNNPVLKIFKTLGI